MAQFDWSNRSESYDRDAGPPDGTPESARENRPRVQPAPNSEEASDYSGSPPLDWTDSGTLRARVAANALELARRGVPKAPFYLTGQVAGKGFSIHAAGDRVILTDATGAQRDINLVAPQDTKPADSNATANHTPSRRLARRADSSQ